MHIRTLLALFLAGFMLCPVVFSEGVLTAGTEKETQKASQGATPKKSSVQKAKVKFRLTQAPKEASPSKPAPPPEPLAEEVVSTDSVVEEIGIFRDSHPHAVRPGGSSPVIKQVSAHVPTQYTRRPVVNYGKAKVGVPAGSSFTVKQKSDSKKSADA